MGDKEVTRFICATGIFTKRDILHRLETEIQNNRLFHIQYWPIFKFSTEDLIGCCGIRPFNSEARSYEIGFHLRNYLGEINSIHPFTNFLRASACDYCLTQMKKKTIFSFVPAGL